MSIDVQSQPDSDDSDDEQIDVVKSAFVPILHRSPNEADSTVKCEPMQIVERAKCDLKAPSSRKLGHENASPYPPRSPETKIKSPMSAQKEIWRAF